MQFVFMPGKGATDVVFIWRRMQVEYRDKEKKLYICFMDMKKKISKKVNRVFAEEEECTRDKRDDDDDDLAFI